MLPQGWTIGRIRGIEIKLNISLALIGLFVTYVMATQVLPVNAPHAAVLIYWIGGLLTSVLFIGCIVWHEMAHSLVALHYGIPVVQIVLYLFGGVAQIARDPERPSQEFWIAIAGPISSLVLAAFFWFLAHLGGVAGVACAWLGGINLTLALFNLLPGFPLDGGRVLRSVLWQTSGSFRKATRAASRSGQVMAACFALLGVWLMFSGEGFNGFWLILIAVFLYTAATASFRMARGASLPMDASVRRVMRFNVPTIEPGLPLAILAWRYMDHAHDQAFPVMSDGQLVGMVTATEVDRIPRLDWGKTRVEQTMVPRDQLCIIAPDDDLQSALQALEAKGANHAPVFDAGQLVGMLNRRDIVYRT